MLKSTARTNRPTRLQVEALEDRQLMSANPMTTILQGHHGTAFALDSQGFVYQNVNNQGWTSINAVARSLAVGTDAAGRDEVYFTGMNYYLYRYDQGSLVNTKGCLKAGFQAGHGELFGTDGNGLLYLYNDQTGWLSTGGYASTLSVGTDTTGRDEVFVKGIKDGLIWRYDRGLQNPWTPTQGSLNSFQCGHGEVFGFDGTGTLWDYYDGYGWLNLKKQGTYLSVGTDRTGFDEVFMLDVNLTVQRLDLSAWTWTSTGGGLQAGFQAGCGEVFGFDVNLTLYVYVDVSGWSNLGCHGTTVSVGSDANGNDFWRVPDPVAAPSPPPPAYTGPTSYRDVVGDTFQFDSTGKLLTINGHDVRGGQTSTDQFGSTTVTDASGNWVAYMKLTGDPSALVDGNGARILGTDGVQRGTAVGITVDDGSTLTLVGL
jgi:hypothetical protein